VLLLSLTASLIIGLITRVRTLSDLHCHEHCGCAGQQEINQDSVVYLCLLVADGFVTFFFFFFLD
jgi:hypothetical protein